MKTLLNPLNLFIGLVLLPTSILADCTPCEEDPDPEAWKKSVAAGFNFTDGNSESSLFNFRAKASRHKGKDVWIFDLEQGWGETNDPDSETNEKQKTADFTKGLAAYQHLYTKVWYVGAAVEANRDDVANVRYRVIPGISLGHYFVKRADFKFSLEAGPSYLFEQVGDESNNFLAPKVGNRFEYALSKTASVFQTATIIMDASDSENYLLKGEAGVTAALTSLFNLVLSVTDTYDNTPAQDKVRNDLAIVSALSVNL